MVYEAAIACAATGAANSTGRSPLSARRYRKSFGLSDAINSWRQDAGIKALVITIQTGGTGLTLNEANTTIFYSNLWSSTDRLQAEDRNHRIGQEQKVTYHDVLVRGRIDSRIMKALKEKQNMADQFRALLQTGKAQVVREFLYDD